MIGGEGALMGGRESKPLWTCPECGQSFVTARMWHSCIRLTEDDWFAGREALRPLYDAYHALARRFGPVMVNINKTRISFQGRVRFAGISRATRNALVCTFWLKRRIDSPRFLKVEEYPRSDFVYSFRLTDPKELDAEVEAWLAEAYEVGMQRWQMPQMPAYHS
jgi:hypothetical protein